MKRILLATILFFPALSSAEYDQNAIKKGLDELVDSFQINSWSLSENGEAYLAKTALKGVVMSVGKNNSGIISSLQNSEQAVQAMLRCLMLGSIGLSPKDEVQRGKIGEVVQSAAQNQTAKSLSMNGVKFEVSPQEVSGNVFLSCVLSPDRKIK